MGKYYKIISADPTSKCKLLTIDENMGHINGFFGNIKYILQVSSLDGETQAEKSTFLIHLCIIWCVLLIVDLCLINYLDRLILT